jgi:cell division protein FtsL
MKAQIINLTLILLILVSLFFTNFKFMQTSNTINDLKNQIELREAQNDNISKKLDSISVKKIEIVNHIDKRTTTINNLYQELNKKPIADTSLSNAILFLNEFANKKY